MCLSVIQYLIRELHSIFYIIKFVLYIFANSVVIVRSALSGTYVRLSILYFIFSFLKFLKVFMQEGSSNDLTMIFFSIRNLFSVEVCYATLHKFLFSILQVFQQMLKPSLIVFHTIFHCFSSI